MFRRLMVLAMCWMPAAAAAADTGWRFGGGDTQGTYYSPIKRINESNVGRLGFAWDYDMLTGRGQEATPLVIGGVMYTSGIWGKVFTLDAKSGRELWQYDPQVPGGRGRYACCDIVNRGVAYRDGVVFVASLDGRIHAIDAKSGKARWIADSIIDKTKPYTSTGAVLLTRDTVIIGNAGSDLGDGGLRGYISAYGPENRRFQMALLYRAATGWQAVRTP